MPQSRPVSLPPVGVFRRRLALAAAAGSALLLAGAFGFQAAGYRPCELCLLQRWTHAAAVAVGAAILLTGHRRALAFLGLLAALAAAGTALYHTGVELQWWAGPTACTGGLGDLGAASTADLLNRIRSAQVVRCDQPAWSFLGLSMAAWNALCSAGLAVLWAMSLRTARR
ncbi:disulfide bond formation protein B [Paracoccus contaminans]|uniref:Disulfide bond formation protein B n=1 Tax=Paracoccus contaminans TaxID=1945662 RepID=A0A1W6CU03_9RHOB|nr:disulfide bond formation protein B [Paracoccus contaminans]